ncbi:MAG: beta-lactamase family protein [Candidatus Thiodiazotropha endolucinida]|uniref:Beta-lactamase family protein n=1 Tax=Candidatus Thiodiazotropha taylori TaxID=2792791 RepID=A0A9E4TV21_9GAMM|nr:beta-lactamase family protein [Candidatus Thiodiazotropha sp. (ex Codakia orbicularis)]MCG7861989.1 beta-lactamase family protein [Candidatus Thiodiazotropha endolucinida]MCG7980441.1 beta-lactamase family protein [Candidatus Thiodiazotropha taylori]MCW4238577.1 beta-lactamase family protein [Candidatus Thiodiazotropha endolucinida]
MLNRHDMADGRRDRDERIRNLTKADLTDLIEQARHDNNIPALAGIVMDAERMTVSDIQGKRVVGSSADASLNDYFHIGSCAKSILAVMAGRLIEQGQLAWGTKFFDLRPDLKRVARSEYLGITLEDLLSCQAGILPYTKGDEFAALNDSVSQSRETFITYLVQQKPASKKKANGRFKHLYSNASYTMAAAMLERVAGLSWEDLIQRTLSDDLGLPVVIGWPNGLNYNQPWGHAEVNGSLQAFSPGHEYRLHTIIAPAGDLSLRPLDYAKYVQLHLQGLRGVDNCLTAETYQAIHYRQQGFSLGVASGSSWGERYSMFDGSAGTFYCASMIFPDSNMAFVIMANSGTGQAVKGISWLTNKIVKKYFNLWWMFWM